MRCWYSLVVTTAIRYATSDTGPSSPSMNASFTEPSGEGRNQIRQAYYRDIATVRRAVPRMTRAASYRRFEANAIVRKAPLCRLKTVCLSLRVRAEQAYSRVVAYSPISWYSGRCSVLQAIFRAYLALDRRIWLNWNTASRLLVVTGGVYCRGRCSWSGDGC
jgi:hypothetical protein